MTSHGGHYEIRIHILTNISRSIYNQTIKFDQLIINTRRNIFFVKKHGGRKYEKRFPDSF